VDANRFALRSPLASDSRGWSGPHGLFVSVEERGGRVHGWNRSRDCGMVRPMKGHVLTVLAAVLALATPAAAQSQRILALPAGPKIVIDVPMGYSFRADFDQVGNARVLLENPVWPIEMVVLVIQDPDPDITTEEWQRNSVITMLAQALPDAKEKDYSFKPLKPRTGTGIYCQLTDAALKKGDRLPPGQWIHLTGGVKTWRGCAVGFQILSNDLTSEEYREALELFRSSFVEK
jgi:hypothetical protein